MATEIERKIRDVTIANKRLTGKSQAQIAKEVGISKMQVCRVLKQDEIAAMVQEGQSKIVSLIPKAADNMADFLQDEDKDYRYKASQDILKLGLTGSDKSPLAVYIQNNTVTINNNLSDELKAVLATIQPAGVIEAEVIEWKNKW